MTVVTDINKLKEEQRQALEAARRVQRRAEKEGRDLSGEDLTAINEAMDEHDALAGQVKTLERLEGISPMQRALENDVTHEEEDVLTVPQDTRANGQRQDRGQDENEEWAALDNGEDPYTVRWDSKGAFGFKDMSIKQARNFVRMVATRDYNEAFYGYLRSGSVSPEAAREFHKVRTMTEGVDADGGYLAPTQLVGGIIFEAQEYEQMKPRMDVIRANVRSLTYTKGLDSVAFGWVAELGTKPEDAVTFGTTTLVPHVGAVVVWVSDELLEDETYGLQGYLQTRVAEAKVLLEEEAFISGSGSGRPFGILTRLNAEASTPNRYTTQVANSFTFNDAIRIPFQTTPLKRRRSVWILGTNAIRGIALQRDDSGASAGTGGYLWQPSMVAGQPSTLNGYSVIESDAVALNGTVTTGNDIGIFGDLRQYRVLERLGLQVKRLEELRALTDEVGFRFRFRTGGDVTLNNAFKTIRVL